MDKNEAQMYKNETQMYKRQNCALTQKTKNKFAKNTTL